MCDAYLLQADDPCSALPRTIVRVPPSSRGHKPLLAEFAKAWQQRQMYDPIFLADNGRCMIHVVYALLFHVHSTYSLIRQHSNCLCSFVLVEALKQLLSLT